jgi:hypothetical protein
MDIFLYRRYVDATGGNNRTCARSERFELVTRRNISVDDRLRPNDPVVL